MNWEDRETRYKIPHNFSEAYSQIESMFRDATGNYRDEKGNRKNVYEELDSMNTVKDDFVLKSKSQLKRERKRKNAENDNTRRQIQKLERKSGAGKI